jgi:diguanylate cyclase (GGDEF)-like protein
LNRRGFESALAEIRKERKTGALLMLDVDHFKEVNDTYGHSIGDMALKVIAKNLISMCRDSDLVVRWGGEEFILFFPETPADQVLKKFTPEGSDKAMINFQFKRSSDPKAHKIEVTFSGGITNLEPGDNLDDAIGKVDETLYAIKNGGRNELKLAPMASPAE